jgi:ribose transport system permease protein
MTSLAKSESPSAPDQAVTVVKSPEPGQVPASSSAREHNVSFLQRYALVGFMVLAFLLFSYLRPDTFPTKSNMIIVLSSQSVVVVLGLALTLTLRMGDLDLSFGAVLTTSAVVFGACSVHQHMSLPVSILLALGFGAAVGAVNALLVVGFGLNSFIATLGTMTVVEGLGYWISSSQVIAGVSPDFQKFLQTGPWDIPKAVIMGWLFLVVMWAVYEYTPFGRSLLFIGGNRRAAGLLGLRVSTIRVTAYVVSGVLYSVVGIMLVGTIGSADPTVGTQYLLPPLAGAFLGTTAVQVGRFNAVGTILGVYTLAIISAGLLQFGASPWVGYVCNGSALILGVILARFAPGRVGGVAGVSLSA